MNLEEQIKALLEKKSEEKDDSKKDDAQEQQDTDGQTAEQPQEQEPAVTIENPIDPNLTPEDVTQQTSPDAEIAAAKEQGDADEKKEQDKENVVAESITDLMVDFSDDFKEKALKIFEDAVSTQVEQVKKTLLEEQQAKVATLEESFEMKFVERCKQFEEEHCEKIDGYLSHLAESWKIDNEIALKAAIKTELSEAFIGNLKQFFESHYMDLPADKVDLYEKTLVEKDEIGSQLAESQEQLKSLTEQLNVFKRDQIIEESTKDFSGLDKARLKSLTEDCVFEDEETFRKKVATIKNSFFVAKGNAKEQLTEDLKSSTKIVDGQSKVNLEESTTMSAYLKVLSRK